MSNSNYKIDTHFVTVEAPDLDGVEKLLDVYFTRLHEHNTPAPDDDPTDSPRPVVTSGKSAEEKALEESYTAKFGKRYKHTPNMEAAYGSRLAALASLTGESVAVAPDSAPASTVDDGGDVL